jgi:sporulation protein YlmC with PRC-barrel domain
MTMIPPTLHALARLPAHRLADGEPDLRGWLVCASDGRRAGRVHDLIVCLDALDVRHLEITLDRGLVASERDRRRVIPVECAAVAARRPLIWLQRHTRDHVLAAPHVNSLVLDASQEARVRRFFQAEVCEGTARFWGVRRPARDGQPYVTPHGMRERRLDAARMLTM